MLMPRQWVLAIRFLMSTVCKQQTPTNSGVERTLLDVYTAEVTKREDECFIWNQCSEADSRIFYLKRMPIVWAIYVRLGWNKEIYVQSQCPQSTEWVSVRNRGGCGREPKVGSAVTSLLWPQMLPTAYQNKSLWPVLQLGDLTNVSPLTKIVQD